MNGILWFVVVLAVLEGGWLTFDGTRALVLGDYVTPKSGPHAGRLGGWSKLVAKVGLDPRSTTMKLIHVVIGVSWLLVVICFLLGASWGWAAMVVCAVAGAWYLPIGTVLSIVQLILLLLPSSRA